ncbi:hypothetical protein D6810_00235 [Candidatus Dojkabacteria bacterium]|uniref:Uncharacterized protein n=1 Tax=Candidatus Dojkabacteria bacterium TaxID=2099670 RepID=A0A3M0Z054_9BACT|nr:MAG: hypothetical protein D6810_00235 [Candidatus Dojkabacteria bacterium]
MRKLIQDIYKIDREILIIRNFIDEDKFKVLGKVAREPLSLIHTSNFKGIKRPKMLVDILRFLKASQQLIVQQHLNLKR